MENFSFIEGPWENSELPCIVMENSAGGDPHILAVIKRLHNPMALYDLCRLANAAIDAGITTAPEIERLDRQSLCVACGQPLAPGDCYYQDAGGGEIHASCCGPERESYVNADGDPLGPDDPIPTPMVWEES